LIRLAQSSGVWARSLLSPSTRRDRARDFGGPMFLKAEQLWRVATVYAKVAEDELGVPSPQRAAFARKAKHLRMLARVAAKIEATDVVKSAQPLKSGQESVSGPCCRPNFEWPKRKHKTLAERLETARAAASAGSRKAPSSSLLPLVRD
jgi:hypothetical protein